MTIIFCPHCGCFNLYDEVLYWQIGDAHVCQHCSRVIVIEAFEVKK